MNDNDLRATRWIVGGILVFIASCAVGCNMTEFNNTYRLVSMAKEGYCQVAVVGTGTLAWQKCGGQEKQP